MVRLSWQYFIKRVLYVQIGPRSVNLHFSRTHNGIYCETLLLQCSVIYYDIGSGEHVIVVWLQRLMGGRDCRSAVSYRIIYWRYFFHVYRFCDENRILVDFRFLPFRFLLGKKLIQNDRVATRREPNECEWLLNKRRPRN